MLRPGTGTRQMVGLREDVAQRLKMRKQERLRAVKQRLAGKPTNNPVTFHLQQIVCFFRFLKYCIGTVV